MNYKPLKLQLRVFLAGHTVAMVSYYVTKLITKSSTMVGQIFETMVVASSNKEWLQRPIKIYVLETLCANLSTAFSNMEQYYPLSRLHEF